VRELAIEQTIAERRNERMNERTKAQNEALFGPSAPSDHAPGDMVRHLDGERLSESKIIHTRAAGPVREGGPVLKAGHIVESGRGWPKFVPVRDVVE
jgi:hypothetical protein